MDRKYNYDNELESSYEELDEMIGFEDYISEVENTLMGAELTAEDLEARLDDLDAYIDDKYDIYDIIERTAAGREVRIRAWFMDTLEFVITGTIVKCEDDNKLISIDNIEEE